MHSILNFFNSPFFVIMGALSTLGMAGGFIYTCYLIFTGIAPIWYRIGMGLSSRKIALFASTEYQSLKDMLIDSKIFKEKNILQIHKNDLKKAGKNNLYLVHWKDYQTVINNILNMKDDSTALIVYAPQKEGRIDQAMLDDINEHRNSIIVNLRGRLLNDILISMLTTSYK